MSSFSKTTISNDLAIIEIRYSQIANTSDKFCPQGELFTFMRRKNGFDVLITMDSNMVYQQDLSAHAIAVVVLRARSKAVTSTASVILSLSCIRFGYFLTLSPTTCIKK